METVSVIGLGYVGLPTAAVIANRGIDVIGVDSNPEIVASLQAGKTHIVEPDLDILVRSAITSGKMTVFEQPVQADVYILAVPTPFTDERLADISYLKKAVDGLAPIIKKGDLLILESTSPVGTTEQICDWLRETRSDLAVPDMNGEDGDIYIAHSPERVLPGRVLLELVDNDRVVGGITPESAARARDFYKLFVKGECHVTDARTAELVKLAENAYRDTNIAFANEMANVCEHLEIDVWKLIDLANRHPRVNILQPGPGVGGHCIAVDPWFIAQSAPDDTPLIRTARNINDTKPERVVARILAAAAAQSSPRIACLGLAYKADIDDLRESPAMDIVQRLASENSDEVILVVEPNIDALPKSLIENNVKLTDLEDALAQASIIVLLTDHTPFRMIDPALLARKELIDTRGVWRSDRKNTE